MKQITGGFGPAREVTVTAGEANELRLRYTLARVALVRETRLSIADLSILRVALARAGARLLPAALVARDEDRERVESLFGEFDAHARSHGDH